MSESRPGYVYIVKCRYFYKIGISQNAERRISGMKTDNPFPITTVKVKFVESYKDMEKHLHNRYIERNVTGEWFFLSDSELDDAIEEVDKMEECMPHKYQSGGKAYFAYHEMDEKIMKEKTEAMALIEGFSLYN